MLRLGEDTAKNWLRTRNLPAPASYTAATPDEAASQATVLSTAAMVKAIVPTGRRGNAGAVLPVTTPQAAREAAHTLLGQTVHGYPVHRVLVEERLDITQELYLAFSLTGPAPEILLSATGGVEIEDIVAQHPDAVLRAPIHPLNGLTSWDAIDLWSQVGVSGSILRPLGTLTAALFRAFQEGDALLLEVNPLAITAQNTLSLVGIMMGIDEDALYRHPEWAQDAAVDTPSTLSEREQRIRQLNQEIPAGECQYIELEGNIGLLVGGGGAGLYQHDLILDLGGAPANHSVTPPTGQDTRKLRAVIEAIFDNPRLRGLLIGFNFAQMARTDIRVRTLVEVLRDKQIDTHQLPIVIRLFGAGEAEARALVEGIPGISYLPRGASLQDAARRIVELTSEASRTP